MPRDGQKQAPLVPPFPQQAIVEPELSRRMSSYPRRDTTPELAIRREVHRRGLRYRVDASLPVIPRRRADLLFSRARVAVFVDGCFWHGCPQHGTHPKNNGSWWEQKLAGNKARDSDTNDRLRAEGWTVLRFWEHEDFLAAADAIEEAVRASVPDVMKSERRRPKAE